MRQDLGVVLLVLATAVAAPAQKRASAAIERTLSALPQSLFFEWPAAKPAPDGKGGLVVVLPGGDGSREFLPWVENGLLAQRPEYCAGVLVTAVQWRDDQKIVWPTAQNRVPGMGYTTEDYVRAVVADVETRHRIDPARRIVVAWSSSGPAVYPLLCDANGPFAGGYVAMSIWPRELRDTAGAKERRFFLDQSPDDRVTPFRFVRQAYDALTDAGAVVRLSVYDGGHGWHDQPLPRLREGLRWLLSDEPAPAPEWPEPPRQKPAKPGKNLLRNGGFEKGLDGWNEIGNSGRLTATVQKDERKEGRRALHLAKTGGAPLDLVTQEVELPKGGDTVVASLQLKSKAVANAWVKVWRYGDDGEPVDTDVDLVRVPRDTDWQEVARTFPRNGAVRVVVQVVVVLDGELWIDDVSLSIGK